MYNDTVQISEHLLHAYIQCMRACARILMCDHVFAMVFLLILLLYSVCLLRLSCIAAVIRRKPTYTAQRQIGTQIAKLFIFDPPRVNLNKRNSIPSVHSTALTWLVPLCPSSIRYEYLRVISPPGATTPEYDGVWWPQAGAGRANWCERWRWCSFI